MFNILPLEVIEYISRLDNEIWFKLVQVYHFLYKKTLDENYVNDLKRKFLLCSTISPKIKYNNQYKYKYNEKFHYDSQIYLIVYYLPNGYLHTFEDSCVALCDNRKDRLRVYYKDNKIHRDMINQQ